MMTTRMLDALMRLFALFAAGRSGRDAMLGRQSASRYLRGRLTLQLGEHYLRQYDQELAKFNAGTARKGQAPPATDTAESEDLAAREAKVLAKRSVKLLRTCAEVNAELALRERMMVFIRLAEFARDTGTMEGDETFLRHAAFGLHIPEAELQSMLALVTAHFAKELVGEGRMFVQAMGHDAGELVGLQVGFEDLFFVKYFGNSEVRLNGQPLANGVVAPMSQGSVLRDASGHSLFFSDLVRTCLAPARSGQLVFEARGLAYGFAKNDQFALHPIDLKEQTGRLVGIMGASGSGKSTLLNVLNGTLKPTQGEVLLNGFSVHEDPEAIAGCVGHIAQEDVLISELSVRDNLRYSARLSFRDLPAAELEARVDATLQRLGLWEIRDLRVGSVMDKTISGGQRKRLNIALELVREPLVLFVDEPTSGLSSRDSEHIMDLLKELTHRGQLIFVVIHQPSSDIFKLFDRLLVLDVGGYLIFDGNPLESVPYFKRLANQVNPSEILCDQCGNVNPEQIFTLIESKVVDEWGHCTDVRRVTPEDWYSYYQLLQRAPEQAAREAQEMLEEPTGSDGREAPSPLPSLESLPQPRWGQQWRTYLERDVHAKARNRTYWLINLFEAPMLALLLAGFTRFHEAGTQYSYGLSENIPPFLFISVIVAFFMGLSVSAEEIIRDRPTLRRERFLNLSWSAYLSAKSTVMLAMSAVQTFAYVLISIAVMEIPGAKAQAILFAVLFSVSAFGNALGLVISSAFQSAKVIYILIPLLVIPQIIFGGAIVRFDRFNPLVTAPDRVPWIGNLMVSRWGFEALAVPLTRDNAYDAQFMVLEDRIERSAWRRDFWAEAAGQIPHPATRENERQRALQELRSWGMALPPLASFENIRNTYAEVYKQSFRLRDEWKRASATDLESQRLRHHNTSLYDWVMQTDREKRFVVTDRGVTQLSAFIHQQPVDEGALGTMLFVPAKRVGGQVWPTEWFNLMVIWLLATLAWLSLWAQWPERISQFRWNRWASRLSAPRWRSAETATR
jgi:ABC-type multidrug transport system ATPase subunit